MKFSGRSVAAASRVMEMDEVLVAISAVVADALAQVLENLLLDRFVFRRRLDHQVAVFEVVHALGDANARQGRLDLVFADDALVGLALHVLFDHAHAPWTGHPC